MTKLTANELKTLKVLFNSAKGNGHDFGFTDDAKGIFAAPRTLSGVISSLVKKGIITVHESITTNEGTKDQATYTQFTWDIDVEEVSKLLV